MLFWLISLANFGEVLRNLPDKQLDKQKTQSWRQFSTFPYDVERGVTAVFAY